MAGYALNNQKNLIKSITCTKSSDNNHKTLNSQKKIWHQNCLVLFKSAHCVLNIVPIQFYQIPYRGEKGVARINSSLSYST